ncbi:hypothetical protein SAMN04487895_10815 [Paenibacillus sophorae]|uniref:Uncharacterized protein n=1 Tax=Paenibacillus sophorae TaxID=1333845 RepID=A0A1H8Q0V3_9BACL|nr:hypothetical protein [Paenibacillus sophorae]QWU15321.1 hypothetical protein KP014_26135 [Paenibacillus sophorae]SEO47567.1 hypothetical protein SAMN04487895_10815 [Paenibacillus sophorae]
MNNEDKYNGILSLGQIQPKILVTILFYAGIITIIYWSIPFGRYISITNKYMKSVQITEGMYTGVAVENRFLGIIAGIIFFLILSVVWKVFCELLLLIFVAFRTYINKNKQ